MSMNEPTFFFSSGPADGETEGAFLCRTCEPPGVAMV